jgi:hypothetical protein
LLAVPVKVLPVRSTPTKTIDPEVTEESQIMVLLNVLPAPIVMEVNKYTLSGRIIQLVKLFPGGYNWIAVPVIWTFVKLHPKVKEVYEEATRLLMSVKEHPEKDTTEAVIFILPIFEKVQLIKESLLEITSSSRFLYVWLEMVAISISPFIQLEKSR